MRRLASINRTTAFLVAVAVVLAGLFLPGIIGALVLAAVVTGMGALVRATWSVTPPPMRAVRLGILALVAVVAVWKVLG